jgi:hypothetical protein
MSTNEIDAPNETQDQASTQHAILRGALGVVHRIGVVAAEISEREWRSPTHLEQRTVERIDAVARAAQISVRSEPEYANGEPTGLMVVEVADGDYPAFVAGMRGQLDTYERNHRFEPQDGVWREDDEASAPVGEQPAARAPLREPPRPEHPRRPRGVVHAPLTRGSSHAGTASSRFFVHQTESAIDLDDSHAPWPSESSGTTMRTQSPNCSAAALCAASFIS